MRLRSPLGQARAGCVATCSWRDEDELSALLVEGPPGAIAIARSVTVRVLAWKMGNMLDKMCVTHVLDEVLVEGGAAPKAPPASHATAGTATSSRVG